MSARWWQQPFKTEPKGFVQAIYCHSQLMFTVKLNIKHIVYLKQPPSFALGKSASLMPLHHETKCHRSGNKQLRCCCAVSLYASYIQTPTVQQHMQTDNLATVTEVFCNKQLILLKLTHSLSCERRVLCVSILCCPRLPRVTHIMISTLFFPFYLIMLLFYPSIIKNTKQKFHSLQREKVGLQTECLEFKLGQEKQIKVVSQGTTE